MILQKYQVLGNDFLIFDCINFKQNAAFLQNKDFPKFIVEKSDRRRLGCDQFIVMEKSTKANAKIVFYNSDGSKAEACGNGTVASGVYASGFLGKNNIVLETDSSIANIKVDGQKATIELPMPKEVELSERERQGIFSTIIQDDFVGEVGFCSKNNLCSINVGNPHCVIRFEDLAGKDFNLWEKWQEIGKKIENMTHIFPHKTNVEFVRRRFGNENTFDVFVWERGTGRTFACGTGACAVAFAMVKKGLANKLKPIKIYMEGSKTYGKGEPIIINFSENSVFLTNHASFEGKIEV
jgi:diaminopimelate epimerase